MTKFGNAIRSVYFESRMNNSTSKRSYLNDSRRSLNANNDSQSSSNIDNHHNVNGNHHAANQSQFNILTNKLDTLINHNPQMCMRIESMEKTIHEMSVANKALEDKIIIIWKSKFVTSKRK